MKNLGRFVLFFLILAPMGSFSQHFDSTGISRENLKYYLKRAVTMAEFLSVDPFANDGAYPHKQDDVRLIHHTGAKFIGRAIYRWGGEAVFGNPEFLNQAAALMKQVHARDPEVIFQAAVFESVSTQVNKLMVPDWAFIALDREIEQRSFRYDEMLSKDGKFKDHWGKGSSVPDITQPEAQLWLMYLCGVYIKLGCEALHLGQVGLMAMNDPGLLVWNEFILKIRLYARKHAPRKWVLLDAHTPGGGMLVDGRSILDFNSFPLRIKEVPSEPMSGVLQVGYLDAIFQRSKGCTTPSGWRCETMPYLVEFDNFGVSDRPGVADTTSHFIWGYDEISWLYQLEEKKRSNWLRYAHQWVAANDKAGYLQMPVSRVVSLGQGRARTRFRGNTRSSDCPEGLGLEKTIKAIWKN